MGCCVVFICVRNRDASLTAGFKDGKGRGNPKRKVLCLEDSAGHRYVSRSGRYCVYPFERAVSDGVSGHCSHARQGATSTMGLSTGSSEFRRTRLWKIALPKPTAVMQIVDPLGLHRCETSRIAVKTSIQRATTLDTTQRPVERRLIQLNSKFEAPPRTSPARYKQRP
jgi:hypothetical protein